MSHVTQDVIPIYNVTGLIHMCDMIIDVDDVIDVSELYRTYE